LRRFNLTERFVILSNLWRYKTNKRNRKRILSFEDEQDETFENKPLIRKQKITRKQKRLAKKAKPEPKIMLCGTPFLRAAQRRKEQEQSLSEIPLYSELVH
jgi:hypothetical protein